MLSGSIVSVSVSSSSWIGLSSGTALVANASWVCLLLCVVVLLAFVVIWSLVVSLCVLYFYSSWWNIGSAHFGVVSYFLTNVTYYIFCGAVVKVSFYEFVAALPAVWYFVVVRWCWEYASSLCLLSLFLYEVYSWSTWT